MEGFTYFKVSVLSVIIGDQLWHGTGLRACEHWAPSPPLP